MPHDRQREPLPSSLCGVPSPGRRCRIFPWTSVPWTYSHKVKTSGFAPFGNVGPGGLPHLAGELFMLRSGTNLTGVSYRSCGESVTAVLSQAVHLTFENVAILAPQIREGTLRALAAQNSTRAKLLPDVPTMAEAGVPNAEVNTFFGLVARCQKPCRS